MKLSNNSIGMLIFIVLATAVFVLMILRPAVDGNAMNLGVPVVGEMAAVDTNTEAETIEASPEKEEKESEAPVEDSSTESIEINAEESSADETTESSTSSEDPSEDASTESTTTN